ncbi:Gfo/Idh/MocA family oxidoreductase [Catenovulum sp. SM1970]|uniref:Gfo/Idh/MocA family protein n=1 Tax=Marinifaba aquimaris TaxID=2741323 RepID=UPI001574BA72|nr:Gfo/Idh/MocA family oxidoreductase [Marinifaba aquimaris]NTS78599.1 Gfo/Idh/MocA family oxidoreductase [Marinifaba aquimaris]
MRFAIIGTNKITHAFIEAANQDTRFELYAVYSRQMETAQAFGQPYGAKCYFDNLEELAQCNEVDAVYIASPNSFHAEQACLLLAKGKHVLCEKPIAANSNQTEKMIATAKANKVCLMEAMMITHLPNYQQIKQQSARIGKVTKYHASFCQYSSRYDLYKAGEKPNTFNLAFANGSLVDIGIYPLYPVIDLFGLPSEINSQAHKLASGVDGCGDVILSYQNDQHSLQAVITHSKISNGANVCEIQGEKGRIFWQHPSLFHEVFIELNGQAVETLTLEQTENRMTYELSHFIDLVEQGLIESPVNSWKLSLQVQSVMDTVRQQQGIIYPADAVLEV